LTYADKTTDVINQALPDYYLPIPATDPVFFNLALDLAKWNKQNKIAETAHHYIDGMEVHLAAGKVLTGVKVAKAAGGYLVFWGATGIATTGIDGGVAGSDVAPSADAGLVVSGTDAASDPGAAPSSDASSGGSTDGGSPVTGTGSGGTGGGGAGGAQPPQGSATSSGCMLSPSSAAPSGSWAYVFLAASLPRRRRDPSSTASA